MKFLDKDTLDIGDILGGKEALGLTALGATALGAAAVDSVDSSGEETSSGLEFTSDFEFAGSKQKDRVKENIERISKMISWGVSIKEIERIYGCSSATVYKLVKKIKK
jgi:hypothetical protein